MDSVDLGSLEERVALRGLAGLPFTELLAFMSAGRSHIAAKDVVALLGFEDGKFELYVDKGSSDVGASFPEVNLIADEGCGGIGALPKSIRRSRLTQDQLSKWLEADSNLDLHSFAAQCFSDSRHQLTSLSPSTSSTLLTTLREKKCAYESTKQKSKTQKVLSGLPIEASQDAPEIACGSQSQPQTFDQVHESTSLVVVASQDIRDSTFLMDESHLDLPPLHLALLEFISWAGPEGVPLHTIQSSFTSYSQIHIEEELIKLNVRALICRLGQWSSQVKKKRMAKNHVYYLARYDGDLEVQQRACESENVRNKKGHIMLPNGSVKVRLRYLSPETLCSELQECPGQTSEVGQLLLKLTGQKGMWCYQHMFDMLIDRKIIKKETLKVEVENKNRPEKKERTMITLLKTFTPQVFRTDFAQTMSTQLQRAISDSGKSGCTFCEIQSWFSLSRRCARHSLLQLISVKLVATMFNENQSAWEPSTIFCMPEFAKGFSDNVTTKVSIKELQERRERVLLQLIAQHKILDLSIETRRLFREAEVREAGNDLPKVTDKKVFVRLVNKLQQRRKIHTESVTLKPFDDEKFNEEVTLIFDSQFEADGPEVQAEVSKRTKELQDREIVKFGRRNKREKPRKIIVADEEASASSANKEPVSMRSPSRSSKRRRVEKPWEEDLLKRSIMSVMWLLERIGNFRQQVEKSILSIESDFENEEIQNTLQMLNRIGWTAKLKMVPEWLRRFHSTIGVYRISEVFRRNIRIKIPSQIVQHARYQVSILGKAPKTAHSRESCEAATAVVALHGLGYRQIRTDITVMDSIDFDGDQDSVSVGPDSNPSTAIGTNIRDPDSKGLRTFFAERLVDVSLSLDLTTATDQNGIPRTTMKLFSFSDAIINQVNSTGQRGASEMDLYGTFYNITSTASGASGCASTIDEFLDCISQLLLSMKMVCVGKDQVKFVSPKALQKALKVDKIEITETSSSLAPFLTFLSPPLLRSWTAIGDNVNMDFLRLLCTRIEQHVYLNPGVIESDITDSMALLASASDVKMILTDMVDQRVLTARARVEMKSKNVFGDSATVFVVSFFTGRAGLLSKE